MNYLADCEPAVRNELTPQVSRTADSGADRTGALLSIVIPTFNERANVRAVVDELTVVLQDIEWEVIFVDDDSPDGTADLVRELGRERARIRCIQRIGRRGLSSACVEGMLGSTAPYLLVMDGDLQHDPKIIPTMLALLRDTDTELAVGSRYAEGGGMRDWSRLRILISRFATQVGRSVVPDSLKDPMSGFFMLRRSLLNDVVRNLSALGFKILVDIVASASRPVVIREVPFEFRLRQAGTSKLDSLVAWEYLMLLADKLIGRYIPVRFVAFAAIGGLGLIVHLSVLTIAYRLERVEFVAAQSLAVIISMIFNYSMNNALTYRDQRRRGFGWLTGLLSFMAVCAVGAVANVGIAAYFFNKQAEWLLAAISGVVVGAVWNYAVTSVYTWGRPKAAKK